VAEEEEIGIATLFPKENFTMDREDRED